MSILSRTFGTVSAGTIEVAINKFSVDARYTLQEYSRIISTGQWFEICVYQEKYCIYWNKNELVNVLSADLEKFAHKKYLLRESVLNAQLGQLVVFNKARFNKFDHPFLHNTFRVIDVSGYLVICVYIDRNTGHREVYGIPKHFLKIGLGEMIQIGENIMFDMAPLKPSEDYFGEPKETKYIGVDQANTQKPTLGDFAEEYSAGWTARLLSNVLAKPITGESPDLAVQGWVDAERSEWLRMWGTMEDETVSYLEKNAWGFTEEQLLTASHIVGLSDIPLAEEVRCLARRCLTTVW